ncbi:DUF47 family protein [Candidatus Bathyarchaeota archaeon]|nr:MAG: DUF47 family protein [Candidatus Bathyarchaeota archaeon]
MAFPVESENRAMRSMLMLYQDHARLLVDIFRKILMMLEAINSDNSEDVKGLRGELEELYERSHELRGLMVKELREVGPFLAARGDLYMLTAKSGELIDYIEGLGTLLTEIAERGWRVPDDVAEGLTELAEEIFNALKLLREGVLALSFSTEKAASIVEGVDEEERRADFLYRRLDLKIITSDLELPLMLLLREVVELLEGVIDRVKEEADLIRVMAL